MNNIYILYIDIMQHNTYNYKIEAFNKEFYCIVKAIKKYNNTVFATISFGVNNKYCVIININNVKDTIGYIDRVEYNKLCVLDGSLERTSGTPQFVSACLYTIKLLFPRITILTLKDDSKIYCKDNTKLHNLSLAHNYIIKYNETYYEKNFGAQLPDTQYNLYRNSLKILDLSSIDYNDINNNDKVYLQKYKNIYIDSKSPRNFIQKLQNIYGQQYCFEVGPWLHNYMINVLNINTYKDEWFINLYNIDKPIKKPINYKLYLIPNEIHGGKNILKIKTLKKTKISKKTIKVKK
jgi:hypothetical protein